LSYGCEDLFNLKRPVQWTDHKLSESELYSIDIEKHKGWGIQIGSDIKLIKEPTKSNALWVNIKTHIQEKDHLYPEDLKKSPLWVQELMKEKEWKLRV